MGAIKYLMIHCTATPENVEFSKKQILDMFKNHGWSKPGYRHIIHLDGRVDNLVQYNSDNIIDNSELVYGASGYNGITIPVAYIGGVDSNMKAKNTLNKFQDYSLSILSRYYTLIYPFIKILGHNQVANKDCPSFSVPRWLEEHGLTAFKYEPPSGIMNFSTTKKFDLW